MRYDVWWRALGNRHWHLVPGVLADSAADAVISLELDSGIEAYAYPRDTSKGYRLTGKGMVAIR
jgi:hypothetical protein